MTAPITDDIWYELGNTDRVKELEQALVTDLTELKNELEENEMVHGIARPVSSVPIPKDPSHFKKERELHLRRALEVCEAKPLSIQAETMEDELKSCFSTDYGVEGMPLLLHQFFVDRMHQLVQCKHMHMLRWRRFCEHTSTIETLYPFYQDRLSHIMAEYNDYSQRAQRLSVTRESFLADKNLSAVQYLKTEDLLIYLRWLVCHLHSLKKFNQFMRVIQWLPTVHKYECSPKSAKVEDDEVSDSVRIPSKYQEDLSSFGGMTASRSKLESASGVSSIRSLASESVKPPTPPPFNPTLQSTNPVPASQLAMLAAASGGGMVSDETNLGLPVNNNDLEYLRPYLMYFIHLYGIEVDIVKLETSADEMELYAAVNRKFKQVFSRQEHINTYKTYDTFEADMYSKELQACVKIPDEKYWVCDISLEFFTTDIYILASVEKPGQENWGADHSMHALKQESNWLPFVSIKPEKDPRMVKKLVELRLKNNVDELLRVMAHFTAVTDAEKVQDTLRSHSNTMREPTHVHPVSVSSYKTDNKTKSIWKKIYTNPNLFNDDRDDLDLALEEFDDIDSDKVKFVKKSRAQSARKRKDSYDYIDAVQLLGLDEGVQDSSDPASIQGAYLAFLQLRHLRIRDLHRTALSLLNYFRSIERMLTINDGGLSFEAGHFKRTSPQNHRKGIPNGGVGGGGGLGSHHYLHNTPRDFKISETEFMEFAEIENHDDFYVTEEGRTHVQDQRGYYIVYDAALDDLKQLEQDLLLVCTHFLEKDRDLRNATGIARSDSARRKRVQSQAGDFDIPSCSHAEVDRFAILMDIWSQHVAFMESKKEVLDCYVEAYHHVFDRDEKRSMAQVIVNLMYQQPRVDFETSYFVRGYRQECICLRLQAELVKGILDKQIQEQREYLQKVCREGDKEFGLPLNVIPKQPISVNVSRSALRNVYMMEFHPSLALASRIPDALKHTYWELYHEHKPESVSEMVCLEKRMLEVAVQEWGALTPLGSSYSTQIQKDLFGDVFIEDPLFISEIAQTLVMQYEQENTRKSPKEKQPGIVAVVGRVMEAVTARHRLIDSAWECEILSQIYRRKAVEMGYDECHLFLRSVQFEFASQKEGAGKPPPLFITAVQEDDTSVDRLVPKTLMLAIHELDESQVGMISFRSREKVLQILKGQGLENLQTVLATQVLHKNALICAVQQASACQPVKDRGHSKSHIKTASTARSSNPEQDRPSSPLDSKSEKSSATAMTGLSSATGATNIGSHLGTSHRNKKAPEAFVSLQLEKMPSRDVMLNDFIGKKATMGTVLRNPEKMCEVKRELIQNFCMSFQQRIGQYSLRGQIISYYNSILGLLEDFPNIRDTYFMLGDPNEKKTNFDTLQGLEPDARMLKKRPRRVLTEDGKHLLNLWFVPHHTELLIMYKALGDHACKVALTFHLRLVSFLHDLLQYLCAHARLGSSHARLGTNKIDFVSADWGGTEGIGADLREIQKQIDHLSDPKDPELVCSFLSLRRDVMFLEFDAAIRHSMKDTFLATGNKQAFQAVSECLHYALYELSNVQRGSFDSILLNVPEPLEPRDSKAKHFYPWRTLLSRGGPYPVMFWQWQQIEYNMQLCLCGLKDVDRHVANGEILGVSLLMEDVLMSGQQDKAIYAAEQEEEETTETGSKQGSRPASAMSEQVKKAAKDPFMQKSLHRTTSPVEAYKLLKSFLLLWKRLEIMKTNWGKTRLNVEAIDSTTVYNNFCKEYKKDVLYPVVVAVARKYGQADMYEGMVSDSQQVILPKGVSEMEIRVRQLLKLLENLECSMISDVRKKLLKSTNLALSERSREESALPTDLWKKPAIKESFTINKPHIAEKFTDQLMEKCREVNGDVSFPREHFKKCLASLSSEVMVRERHNFENYSMFYENLLRVNHQLLYQKEQEVKQVKDMLRTAKNNTITEVQCQLADTSQELLLEITALRAKVAEMREQTLTQEGEIREKVREEYDDLVHNLFIASFDIKKKFDEFRENFHDDVHDKITDVRRDAMAKIRRLNVRDGADSARSRSSEASSSVKEESTSRELQHAERMRDIQQDNHQLNVLLMKMRSLATWKANRTRGVNDKLINAYKKNADHSKKELLEIRIIAEEEVLLLREQLRAMRDALKVSEQESETLRRELEKELKVKKEKSHAAQQKAQSQKQLEEARRSNIDRLITELGDKEVKLKQMTEEQDKSKKLQQLTTEKVRKDVTLMKKQLNHERNLKLDAFTRVDELQTTIYDIESLGGVSPPTPMPQTQPGTKGRPQTAIGTVRSKSRVGSAKKPASRCSQSPQSGVTSVWPPTIPWPANRSPTPLSPHTLISGPGAGDSQVNLHTESPKKIQRPKTSMGRLRSRISDQLLNELDPPDHHETILRLRQLQEMRQEKVLF